MERIKERRQHMSKKTPIILMVGLLLALVPLAVVGQEPGCSQDEEQSKVRLLLVDETKTFSSTMRVGALAGILRKSGMVDVSVELIDVESSYEDPLSGIALAEEPYDLILIIPRGIDDSSVKQIWLVTRFFEETSPEYAALTSLSAVIDHVFQGIAEAIDVREDLWPGFYAALYLKQGWLR
jgi:hypothetical protein